MISEYDLHTIFDALTFSADKHKLQRRKDREKTPYINHPIGVANHIITTGHVHDMNIIIAAILHDVIEDTATTPQEIEEKFGVDVVNLVMEVTDDKSLSREKRRQHTVDVIFSKSPGAKIIKLADFIHNISSIPSHWSKKAKTDYISWVEDVFKNINNINEKLEQLLENTLKEAKRKHFGH